MPRLKLFHSFYRPFWGSKGGISSSSYLVLTSEMFEDKTGPLVSNFLLLKFFFRRKVLYDGKLTLENCFLLSGFSHIYVSENTDMRGSWGVRPYTFEANDDESPSVTHCGTDVRHMGPFVFAPFSFLSGHSSH